MNKQLIYSFILFLLIVIGGNRQGYAQAGSIINLEILPNTPTSEDTIKIISEVQLVGTSPCGLDSVDIKIDTGKIVIEAFYSAGFGGVGCNSTDTVIVGVLCASDNLEFPCLENYELIYNAYEYWDSSLFDSDTIGFSLIPVKVPEQTYLSDYIRIYPNPAKDVVGIEMEENVIVEGIRLYDLSGRIIRTYPSNTKQISITGIKSGIYFISVKSNHGIIRKKIIIN